MTYLVIQMPFADPQPARLTEWDGIWRMRTVSDPGPYSHPLPVQ